STDVPSFNINNLEGETSYEVQVAVVCNGTTGAYSSSVNFTTTSLYCTTSVDEPDYEYISNITVGNINNSSNISASGYSNYATNTALQVNLTKGVSTPISLTITGVDNDAAAVWIDYNKDGVFTDNEMVLDSPVSNSAVRTGTFTVPASAAEGQPLRMRAIIYYGGPNNVGASLSSEFACGALPYGEIEDYNVVVASTLSTSETKGKETFSIYPNPVSDILNVTKVSNKATYEIHNTVGQIVKKGTIDNNKVNVTELLKGNYIISVKDNNISESFKFIKK
ncbi:GEVED domain-containing protein, partial [Chryseobacterium sp.]|uniref:GEVED domain-containing protein n=1 Tax=Chryseobacterium sp. TaxID=1871047 RepID=UPI002899104F